MKRSLVVYLAVLALFFGASGWLLYRGWMSPPEVAVFGVFFGSTVASVLAVLVVPKPQRPERIGARLRWSGVLSAAITVVLVAALQAYGLSSGHLRDIGSRSIAMELLGAIQILILFFTLNLPGLYVGILIARGRRRPAPLHRPSV